MHYLQEVANRGAGGAGDDADAAGERRQPAFAGRIEQSLGGEFVAALAEGEFEGAHPFGLEFVDDELVAAARRVKIKPAAADDFDAVVEGQF